MKFTIFTGCYNSSQFIERVFKSIKDQTYRDFEWIIIDDASKDNTVEILKKFKKENPSIDITLITRKENVGVAANRKKAIFMSKGDFFITWDHDDVQLPEQLEMFKNSWETYGNDDIANIFAFCQDQYGKKLGEEFKERGFVSNYFSLYSKHFMTNIVKQEKHVCSKVRVLKDYIDHSFEEGKIIDGEMLWAKIATNYNSIFINEAVRVYFIENSNKNNMSNKTRTQMANSVYYQKTIWVNHFLKHLKNEPKLQLRLLFSKSFYGILSKKGIGQILGSTKGISSKILVALLWFPALGLYWKMKIRGKGL